MTVETELLVAGVVAPPAGTAASIAAHAAVVDWCLAFAYRVELLVDNVNERPWRGRVRRGTADLTEYLGAVGVVELGRRS